MTQRRILERLAEHAVDHPPLSDFDAERFPSWLTVADLAEDGTRSARESARRAVLRLESEGRVQVMLVAKHHPRGHLQLCARLTPDPATAEAWRSGFDRRQEERRVQRALLGI